MALEHRNNLALATPTDCERYLGISVHPSSFGFIVIEAGSALDCGVRLCDHPQFDDCLATRFQRILRIYSPSTLIVLSSGSKVTRERRNAIARALTREAARKNSPVIRVGSSTVHRYFHRYNAVTRHEIAQAVAAILPELAWRLPPQPKPWQTDAYRMPIFDAAAGVITHATL